MTGTSGQITSATNYAPYGNVLNSFSTYDTSLGFTGEYADPTGLLYLRARYYNSNNATFLTLDPIRNANRYAYVSGNPIRYVDPTGMQEESPTDICYSGIIGSNKFSSAACVLGIIEFGIGLMESTDLDASSGYLGELGPNDTLRIAIEQDWSIPAHFMRMYLGLHGGIMSRRPWKLGEDRYMNLCLLVSESPNLEVDIIQNFIDCVIEGNCQGPAISAGTPLNSLILNQGETSVVNYTNLFWSFRVAPTVDHIYKSVGTFSVGTGNGIATIEHREDGTIVYTAQLEAWDKYNWINNNDSEAEGNHPFGMQASDFELLENSRLAAPYILYSRALC